MSQKAEDADERVSQASGRHSSHKEISSRQHAKELNDTKGQDDAQEPSKPTITEEEVKEQPSQPPQQEPEVEAAPEPAVEKKAEGVQDDVSPRKPNMPLEQKEPEAKPEAESKPKLKPTNVNKNKNRPDIDRKLTQSKKADKTPKKGTESKKKEKVETKPAGKSKNTSEIEEQVR